jgi:hypothetical protein
MALTDAQVPTASADIVAIFDQNFNQLFRLARPIKAAIKEDSKLMEHPVETGATITDHSIILPIEIELSLITTRGEYLDVYQRLRQAFKNRDLLVAQTKTGLYENMLIQSMPHEEDPELFDSLTIAVTLKEVQLVTAQFAKLPAKKVRNPSNASTVDKGQQQPKESTKTATGSGSVLFGIFN